MNRYYLENIKSENGCLFGSEAHHAISVMREKIGNKVSFFDGKGIVVTAEITDINNKEVAYKILSKNEERKKEKSINLLQAIPKKDKIGFIIQKTTELGVNKIIFFLSSRTLHHSRFSKTKDLEKHISKWKDIAIQTAKQCKRAFLPQILFVSSFEEAVKIEKSEVNLVACFHSHSKNAKSFRKELWENDKINSVSVLIGPEGDFSDNEIKLAITEGFKPISLGNEVLRCETAAIYCVSFVKYELDA